MQLHYYLVQQGSGLAGRLLGWLAGHSVLCASGVFLKVGAPS